jgi:hypothetical protein
MKIGTSLYSSEWNVYYLYVGHPVVIYQETIEENEQSNTTTGLFKIIVGVLTTCHTQYT